MECFFADLQTTHPATWESIKVNITVERNVAVNHIAVGRTKDLLWGQQGGQSISKSFWVSLIAPALCAENFDFNCHRSFSRSSRPSNYGETLDLESQRTSVIAVLFVRCAHNNKFQTRHKQCQRTGRPTFKGGLVVLSFYSGLLT